MRKWYWVVLKTKKGRIMNGVGFSPFDYADLKIEERPNVVSIHAGTQRQITSLVQLRDASDIKPLAKQSFMENIFTQMRKVK